ncbi:hypothetical protein ABN028_15540 [Actinopolymorpha sp. B17G11]|uniref:SCO7613 C-terminal domain-containing membrane protein n=1 Tax=Actinopolymorpha sp. B17G11 TaxID=3160861 RepID=UPI0032E4C79C
MDESEGSPPTSPASGDPSPLWEQLREVDARLAWLATERDFALRHRATLVAALDARPATSPAPGHRTPPTAGQRRELSVQTVQNLLLVLGGALLSVAAAVFTIWNWGQIGLTGRAAILGAITAVTLAIPKLLLVRNLRSTAETVALLGFALVLLDGYAARWTGLAGLDRLPPGPYAAGLVALVSAGLVAYSRVLPPLRLPVSVALVLAQIVLPLLAWNADPPGTASWLVAALIATAAFDVTVAVTGRALRRAATTCFGFAWSAGVLVGLAQLLSTPDPVQVRAAAGLLAVAVLVGLAVTVPAIIHRARPLEALTPPVAVVSAVTACLALATPLRIPLDGRWQLVPYAAAGLLVLAATPAARWLPAPVRGGCRISGAGVAAASALPQVPILLGTIAAPVGWIVEPWSGAPDGVRGVTVAPSLSYATSSLMTYITARPADLVVLGLLLGCFLLLAVGTRSPGLRSPSVGVSIALGAVMMAEVPVALDFSYEAAIGTFLVAAVVSTGAASRLRDVAVAYWTGTVSGVLALLALSWALATETATLVVLGVLALGSASQAVLARVRELRPVSAMAATFLVGGFALASGLAAGWPARSSAFLVLGVAAVGTALAAVLARRSARADLAPGVEWGSAVLVVAAILLTFGDARLFGVGLASAGVLALATSLRPARRSARPVGLTALVLSSWVLLWAEGVGLIEAYTVPASIILLGLGWWRRRTVSPGPSSWHAYGSGLSFTLAPSLLRAVTGEQWERPLLLGTCCLAITLLGAWRRLQAPAVLGGGALVVLGGVELAPFVAELLVALPRWIPFAVGGLLLLVVGATYEHRLRDVRRLRSAVARLH